MFKVAANNIAEYLAFDPDRKSELEALDRAIKQSAPALERYFHAGTPKGEAGMRFKMIGYGKFRYSIKSGKSTDWPVIGVALQKSYISVYIAATRDGNSVVDASVGKLGAQRIGRNNFSFKKFEDLDTDALSSLFQEVANIVKKDPENPRRNMERSTIASA